jgi:glycosyltransferase involved in cell wall biosynthesis
VTAVAADASTGLVHDYLLVMRGAERAFGVIADCWPDAPIYTLLYDREGTGGRFDGRDVHTSYLQHLGVRQAGFRGLLPLLPRAAERLPVKEHDLVISSSSAFAHGVQARPGAIHICYCHTPFRYAWVEQRRALDEAPRLARPIVSSVLKRIREWDLAASRRVTHYIANSEFTRRRMEEVWGREASVVHPPVDVDRFKPAAPEDFLLVVTELVRHKRVELALEAARRAGRRLKVVGTGPDLGRLRHAYGESAEFLGRISDDELGNLYARALALLVPNVEEFGIAAVEAQAAGRPVVAFAAGGAMETVLDGTTGVLVSRQDVHALAEAIADTDFERFSAAAITQHAGRFSTDSFRRRFSAEVARLTRSGAEPSSPART